MKDFISEIMSVDPKKLKFISKGKILKDDSILGNYGIASGDSVIVIVNNRTP